MSLRIAMIAACPFPARRGTPLRIERLTEALIARGHEVEVITYHLCDNDEINAYPIHRIFNRSLIEPLAPGPTVGKLFRYDPAMIALTRSVIKNRTFDAIHAHHVEGLMIAKLALGRKHPPIVYDAHTLLEGELDSYWRYPGKRIVSKIGRGLDHMIARQADHIISVTDDIRADLIAQHDIDPGAIEVAMNGVELTHFSPAVGRAPTNSGRLVYSGTLAAYQGVSMLLEAFAIARTARPALSLVIASSADFGPYEADARRLGIRDAIILETDHFEHLPQRLADAAVAVLPRPDCPGIPQKLLNYMAAGKAIVACEGSAKILTNGIDGMVVPNNDAAGFANALVRLHDDQELRSRIGMAAYQHVKPLSWDRTAGICEAAYLRLTTR